MQVSEMHRVARVNQPVIYLMPGFLYRWSIKLKYLFWSICYKQSSGQTTNTDC